MSNVVAFEPKPEVKAPSRLHSCLMTIDPDTVTLSIELFDVDGKQVAVAAFAYIGAHPPAFDVDELLQAWDRWRGPGAQAS